MREGDWFFEMCFTGSWPYRPATVTGGQYTNKAFQFKLSKQGMEQSMSRIGHCIDNCPVEGFWGIVKAEMYFLNKFSSGGELHSANTSIFTITNVFRNVWSKDANGSSYGNSEREDPGIVPDCREQTDSEIQSEIRGITKCRKSHADTKTPAWDLRL